MTGPVAAVDCGTNSVRLLVTEHGHDLVRTMRIVRLGQGVDRTGRLDPAAIERTRVALAEYAGTLRDLGVTAARMVATSATRDAANRDDFVAMVRATLDIEPEVVTGDEEARLSYAGATAGVEVDYPVLVADIGGGSTELVLGDMPGRAGVRAARSVDVGCVRLTERRLHSDPPTAGEVAAARADIAAVLDSVAIGSDPVPVREASAYVGLAGSVTTVVAHALRLPHYDAERIHGARVAAADVQDACAELLAMTRAQRAALPFMHPGRVDVIGGGALVVSAVLTASGCDAMIASEHDILDGIAASLA
ncbi:MAG TPA: Ppx/GppA phosphatase family protein [Mycobacteriales bacterium]|nr:Ppx/GppA phosphatase family protein [Mycobacteriales bacterium]